MRVATIFVRTGTQSFADAEGQVDALFAAQLPAVERDIVVVDNLLGPGVHEQRAGRVVLGGDNSAREFSAFDVGLRYLAERPHRYDWVNLVTSAFNTLYTDYLRLFTPPLLDAAAGGGVCLGHVDYYNEPVRVCGCPSQHWLRTSFIMLPPSELELLDSVVSVRDAAPFFSGEPQRPFRDDAPLCSQFRRYITDWLGGRDIGQGVKSHSRFELDDATLPTFQAKTLAILNEHMLGVRLRARGCVVADISWAAHELASGAGIRWELPWREQLARYGRHVPAAVATA